MCCQGSQLQREMPHRTPVRFGSAIGTVVLCRSWTEPMGKRCLQCLQPHCKQLRGGKRQLRWEKPAGTEAISVSDFSMLKLGRTHPCAPGGAQVDVWGGSNGFFQHHEHMGHYTGLQDIPCHCHPESC